MELRKVNFNGKVYGKKGSYSIYVKGTKVEVSDEQADQYFAYMAEYETVKSNFPKALKSRRVEVKAIELGIAKMHFETSLEQHKAQLEAFEIETVFELTKNGISGKIEKVTHNGEFIEAYASFSNGRESHMSEDQLQDFLHAHNK